MSAVNLLQLRRLIHGVRKRMFPPKQKFYPRKIVPGLPDGIDRDLLNEVSRKHFDSPVQSTAYEHLSGWKTSGAYRIHFTLVDGRVVPLIYKIASYSSEDIPAMLGLPMRPGPAEYTIYSQPPGPLAPYLPHVYWAEELTPGECYRYILEDLRVSYFWAIGTQAIARAGALLPAFHQALNDWTATADTRGLLTYGTEYSRGLQAYSHPRIERFQAKTPDPLVKQVLDRWTAISVMHLRPEFHNQDVLQMIHGDTNFSNVHLHNTDSEQMKLVDWEWAGFGLPQSDLASLLKGADALLEKQVVQPFGRHLSLDARQNWRLYYWSQLERGLLDMGFLSAQYLDSARQGALSLPKAIHSAAQRLLVAYNQLSS
jgi:hypothetical protein